ncbi:benzoate 4-monooxygenase cytochrome P450 [Metarhizium brunneum]
MTDSTGKSKYQQVLVLENMVNKLETILESFGSREKTVMKIMEMLETIYRSTTLMRYSPSSTIPGLRARVTAYDAKILKAGAGLLVVTGSHTTSANLSGIFFYLTGDPRRLIKVQNEIRGILELANDIIHGPKLASCTYLRARVDEAMRLTSSGPSELPREVMRGRIHIQGQYYPAGTVVGTSSWCDARNQRVYGDTDVYRPERWIVDEAEGVTKEHVARLKANFNPFGAGPGHCIGKVFAMSEILIAVARTLHRLGVRRTPGSTLGAGHPSLGWGARSPQQLHLKDAYITIRHGQEVQFRKRTTGSLGE